ncbi:MAG: YbjN domain-containing protein [Fretibacterium sp.]|nr:YbjN domain-containing protein [Fretibacterium sp.]
MAAWAEEGYSQDIAEAVNKFLLKYMEGGAKMFTFDQDEGVFRTTLKSEGTARLLGCVVVIADSFFRTYVVSPIGVDPSEPSKLAAMAEFICRVNYGLFGGGFEMDFNDGEIRFRSFVDCSGGLIPSEALIGNSIVAGTRMFERYLPGIKDVLFNGTSPKEAVEKCEN